MTFVITAIDYLDRITNDCFFKVHGSPVDRLNESGPLKGEQNRLKQHFFSLKEDLYPYLLVNLRSGATFTRVDAKDKHHRICGTSIGSSFFWGVLRLLNYFNDPTEAVRAAT